jgi:hypothetical protein
MMNVAFIIGFAGNRQGTIWPECDGEMRKKQLQLRAENLAVKGMHVYGSDGLPWKTSVNSVAYSAMVVR